MSTTTVSTSISGKAHIVKHRKKTRKSKASKSAEKSSGKLMPAIASFIPKFETPRQLIEVDTMCVTLDFISVGRKNIITHAPYQRGAVWNRSKQNALLDSILRYRSVPEIFTRALRRNFEIDCDMSYDVYDVIDGQQRIDTVYAFLDDEIRVPLSLTDHLHKEYCGKKLSQLPAAFREHFLATKLSIRVVRGLPDAKNFEQLRICTDLFRRFNATNGLKTSEKNYAALTSRSRNVAVYYADTRYFDYDNYESIAINEYRLKLFDFVKFGQLNKRKEHVMLFLWYMMQEHPTFLVKDAGMTRNQNLTHFVDIFKTKTGIADLSLKSAPWVQTCVTICDELAMILGDVFQDTGTEPKHYVELGNQSMCKMIYLVHRELRKQYAVDNRYAAIFREFMSYMHKEVCSNNKKGSNRTDMSAKFDGARHETFEDMKIRMDIALELFARVKRGQHKEGAPKTSLRKQRSIK